MGNQVPAIQSFSSPPPLPALIRQNNKVLSSKQTLVLCSPRVQGGRRELPRRSLLLLWHLGVTHRWGRDLGREDTMSCWDTPSAEPEHTGPTAVLLPLNPLAEVSAGLEPPKPGATQRAEQQLQEELEHWSRNVWTVSIREGQLMPKLSHFPPYSWNNLGGKGALEVS